MRPVNASRRVLGLLMGRRLPVTSGTLRVQGLRAEVTILRDRFGIPHVQATGDGDAAFALGFCQGQDRAFQLEVLLRVARGTLAELVGAEALPVDRLARRVGFRQGADRQLAACPPGVREALEAFARGVTAGATRGCPRRPHEFVLLRSRPTPWEAEDVVAVSRLVALTLASNWDAELVRLKLLEDDGPEAVTALDPTYPEGMPTVLPAARGAGAAADRLARDLGRLAALVGSGGGSNAWALAGSRTASGRPLLANDPHLPPTLPPHWYLAHVRTPRWEVAGATFVGGPAFEVATNGHAAWGVTSAYADVTDLFVEEVEGDRVRVGDGLVPCERRVETILVRGGQPVTEEVLVTPHGPVVSPALGGTGRAISLRGTWLEARPLVGFLKLHEARTFEEARRLLADWPGTPLSVVWAEASGTVGFQLAAVVPRRRAGAGTMPAPGWEPDSGWEEDPVPFEDLPSLRDPEEGFVVTANNRLDPDDRVPDLGADSLDGYRAARIVEAVSARRDWDVASTLRLQLDLTSLPWREVREVVLGAPATDPDARLGLDLLAAWDGVVGAESPAATVYELLACELVRRVVRARAPRAALWALGRGFHPLTPTNLFARRWVSFLARLLREQPAGWLPRPWLEEVAAALADVVRFLRGRFGEDPKGWAWGRVRPFSLVHPLGGRRPLDRVFNLGPLPAPGDSNTVAQYGVAPADPLAPPTAIPSLRAVIDVGHPGGSRFSLPGGQSGNPASPHYDDLLPLWQAGDGVPIAWSPEEVRAAAVATLRLVPA